MDAYLIRCYRCGFSSKTEYVGTLFDTVCMELFNKMPCSGFLSALEVFLKDMRYINSRFTYLLTYFTCLHDILPSVSNHAVLWYAAACS